MKKYFLLVFLLLPVLLSAQISQKNLIGKQNRLLVSTTNESRESLIYVEFLDEKTYTFFSPVGGYLWEKSDYKIQGNIISLSILSKEKPFYKNELNTIFSSKNKNKFVDFTYDAQCNNINYIGGYRNGNVFLTDRKNKTPQGIECNIENIKVIKKTGYLVPIENLKVRKAPSTNAETGNIDYHFEFMCLTDEKYMGTGQLNADYDIELEKYGNNTYQVLLAGMIRSFDGVTVEKQTIDGITAPWYRIPFYDNDEGFPRYYWIFGGYIEEISDKNTHKYDQLFYSSASQKGFIKAKSVKLETKAKKIEQAKKVLEVAKVLYSKGNTFVSNDMLKDSQIKIGMTKQAVIDLLGPSSEVDERGKPLDKSILQYDTFEATPGAGYTIKLTLENDKVIKIYCEYEK